MTAFLRSGWCALQDLNGPGRPLLPQEKTLSLRASAHTGVAIRFSLAAIHLACDLRMIDPLLYRLAVPEKCFGLSLFLAFFDRCGNHCFAFSATGSAKL